jgi:putative two-component system response regulator
VANVPLREALARDLRGKGFTVTRAVSGMEAERVVKSVSFDAVLVESHLPDMSADELKARIQKTRPECRVIIMTSFDLVRNSPEQLQYGPEDYLIRTEQMFDLLRPPVRDAGQDGSSLSVGHRGNVALIQVIDVLVGLLEVDERFFGGFSHKAMHLAREVALELSAGEEAVQEVTLAALLRDLGKVDVEPEVLSERGPYTDDQKANMRKHVEGSQRLFEHIQFPWKVLPVIRGHHERYDGKGYPDGLRGREIPIGARIIAVVDAYVAMTSERSHREALEPDAALQRLMHEAGRQFDPEIVETFQRVLDKRLPSRKVKKAPRVLLVDSQEDFRKLLKMRLLNDGLEVEENTSCERAMELLLKEPPNLVLIDLDGDEAAAFQLLEEIRQDESLCRIPFAFLSRRTDRVVKIRALREGVDEFLCKDDDMEELVARVQNVLTRETLRRAGKRKRVRRGVTGDLENLNLPDIVQTLVMGMKTACVTLASEDRNGKIWFDNGQVKHAATEEKSGEQAFYEMLRWTTGEFTIEHGINSSKATLERDAMYLLMEGLRLIDEDSREAALEAS